MWCAVYHKPLAEAIQACFKTADDIQSLMDAFATGAYTAHAVTWCQNVGYKHLSVNAGCWSRV